MFCFSVFRVFSGCCLVVNSLGGGMTSEVMYMNVGSQCSDHDYFYNDVYFKLGCVNETSSK